MPTGIPYPNVGYTLNQSPLTNLYPLPIIAKRNPSTADKGVLSQIWVNKSTGAGFILTMILAGVYTWTSFGGGAGSFTNIVASGSISAGTTITAGTGITATTGNIVATAGAVNAGTTMTAGTGITATTGAITATAGKVIAGTTLQANGDAAGVASTTSLSNVVATAAGAGTVTFAANAAGNINQTGWMKAYVGTTPVYLPYFDTI